MPPPSAHNLLASAAGRREVKRARRAVLVQCTSCGAVGTGTQNAFGSVASDLSAAGGRHRQCGGRLEAFDIEVAR